VDKSNILTNFEVIVDRDGRPMFGFIEKWQRLLRGHRGALVKKSADQTGADYSAGVYMTWDTETYDTSTFHDTATNTERFTIPKGVSKVRVGMQVVIENITANSQVILGVAKNASISYSGIPFNSTSANATSLAFQAWSPVLQVVQGDYFRAFMQVPSDSSIDVLSANSWFAIEVIE